MTHRTNLEPVSMPDVLPKVLPSPWIVIEKRMDGSAYQDPLLGLRVIASTFRAQDGKAWLHVSCSRADKLPSWDEMKLVKDLFVGIDRYAYQVFPPKSRYVNFHPHVLHLWSCLDAGPMGEVLPDFAEGGMI
jgi:hypothetical protein